jgi:hypothetical protein
MSLDGLLLEKLARWRPDGRQTLEVSDTESGWNAAVTADAADLVGCRLWEVSLRRASTALPGVDLKNRGQIIAGRVTGLLEPLRLIEVDETRAVALIRSDAPTRRDEAISYYEALMQADGGVTLRRYEAPRGEETRRQQIAYGLTYESLGKLVTDLTN